jgi:hypothetical protein
MKSRKFLTILFFAFSLQSPAQNLKALVGGTLIDSFGGIPIRNSVIIIEGERIKAFGQVGSLPWVTTGATHDSYWFDDFYSMMICSLVSSPSTTTWI